MTGAHGARSKCGVQKGSGKAGRVERTRARGLPRRVGNLESLPGNQGRHFRGPSLVDAFLPLLSFSYLRRSARMAVPPPPSIDLARCSSEPLFECAVCTETFSDPVSTPCGHTFCMLCLRQWIERGQATPPPRCPVCRNEITQDPASLHVNIVLADLVRLRAARASAERSTATLGTLAQPSTAIPVSSGAPAALAQLLEMGFPESTARTVLDSCDWKATVAIEKLFGSRPGVEVAIVPSLTAPQKASLATLVDLGIDAAAAADLLAACEWDLTVALQTSGLQD